MYPVMPNATALWLLKNTTLTNEQIKKFTGINILIITRMRNYPDEYKIALSNPIDAGETTLSDIRECENSPDKELKIINYEYKSHGAIKMDSRAPSIKKLNAIKWIVSRSSYQNISDMFYNDVARFFQVSPKIVQDVYSREHKKSNQISEIHPVYNNVIKQPSLDFLVKKYNLKLD